MIIKIATYAAAFGLLAFLAGNPATAQSNAKADPTPTSKATSSKHTTRMISDSTFAREAAEGGIAEVKFGQLAEEKGSSQEVKDFGKRMVTDHTKGNDQLKADAAKEKFTLPTDMSKRDQMAYDRLSKLSGSAFDRAYGRDMVRDHRADVAEFLNESKNGKQEWTKDFASHTLPTLREHLKQAEEMLHKVEPAKTGKA
jgi:putative membrane protein